jgi:hypothetical protein
MSDIKVIHAVYGALPGADPRQARAADVTAALQAQIDRNNGVVTCGNGALGDSAPGYLKHFGAVISRGGANYYYACQENQAVDFRTGGGRPAAAPAAPAAPDLPANPFLGGADKLPDQGNGQLKVKFAVYGGLQNGGPDRAAAYDVTQILETALSRGSTVACNNDSFGDCAVGTPKHFAAIVVRNGQEVRFACQENQSIDFLQGGG